MTRLLAIYSIVATVALAVMARRVKVSNRHARIACMLAAAATTASHDYWTTDATHFWN
jgi:hypothetical protein